MAYQKIAVALAGKADEGKVVGEAIRLSKSLGASLFVSYRTHRYREMALAEAESADEFGLVTTRDDFDYYHLNTIEVLPDTPLGRRDSRFRPGGRYGAWTMCPFRAPAAATSTSSGSIRSCFPARRTSRSGHRWRSHHRPGPRRSSPCAG